MSNTGYHSGFAMKKAGVVIASPITSACWLPSWIRKEVWPGLWPLLATARMPGATCASGRSAHALRIGAKRRRALAKPGGAPRSRGSPRRHRSRRPIRAPAPRPVACGNRGPLGIGQPADMVAVEMRVDDQHDARRVEPRLAHVRMQRAGLRPADAARADIDRDEAARGLDEGHVERVAHRRPWMPAACSAPLTCSAWRSPPGPGGHPGGHWCRRSPP
jgi:hypothetical protein